MINNFSVTLVQCPGWGTEAPPLAIALLAGNLRSKGFKVQLLDLNVDFYHRVSDGQKKLWRMGEFAFWASERSVKRLVEKYTDKVDEQVRQIIATGGQLVGFTLYYTTIYFTMEIIKRLKSCSPDILVVLGGPSTIESVGGLDLLNNPNVDAIVLREGDETLPAMCQILNDKQHLEKIPGLVFKEGDQIIDGGPREPIPLLDTLPFPDYSDFDLSQYEMPERLDIFSSRGCVNRCHYCSEQSFFGRFRFRSGKSLFEEVQYHLSKFPDVKLFVFSDSVFNGSLKAVREFAELLVKNNIKIVWGGQGIVHKGMTPELLNLMFKAGCVYIGYGIESGSEVVRKSMNKGSFSNVFAARIIRDTHDAGIKAGVNFMFGYPTETEEDFQRTLDFVSQNYTWIDEISPSHAFTAIVPDTYLYENPGEFGVEKNVHYLFWETKDGKNTYLIRSDRYERFCKLCLELGYSGRGITEERLDKWKILGDYYYYKKDYEKANEYHRNDLLKDIYLPEYMSVK